jgi:hypothetical protein
MPNPWEIRTIHETNGGTYNEMWSPFEDKWIFVGWIPTPTEQQQIDQLEKTIAYAKAHFPTRVRGLQKQLDKLVATPKH